MWRILALVALIGCGRIGFDERSIYYTTSNKGAMTTLLSFDVETGHMAVIGTFSGLGEVDGLALWDANTLYGTTATPGMIVEITLEPFSARQVGAYSGGIAVLERSGDHLIAIKGGSELVTYTPGDATVQSTGLFAHDAANQQIASSGGDLVRGQNGELFWFTNSTVQLFRLDEPTGLATPVGPPLGTPNTSGMIRGDDGDLYVTASLLDALIELDPATGVLGATRTLCIDCPTPYDLGPGDTTQYP